MALCFAFLFLIFFLFSLQTIAFISSSAAATTIQLQPIPTIILTSAVLFCSTLVGRVYNFICRFQRFSLIGWRFVSILCNRFRTKIHQKDDLLIENSLRYPRDIITRFFMPWANPITEFVFRYIVEALFETVKGLN